MSFTVLLYQLVCSIVTLLYVAEFVCNLLLMCCVLSIEDIKRILTAEISRRGDTLLSFGDDVRFLCFRHVSKLIYILNSTEVILKSVYHTLVLEHFVVYYIVTSSGACHCSYVAARRHIFVCFMAKSAFWRGFSTLAPYTGVGPI